MRSFALRWVLFAFAVAFTCTVFAPRVSAAPDPIEQGRYLVGPAGQCADCHGADLRGMPMFPGPPGVPWAKHSSNLRGLPMFATDAAAIAFFRTARLATGAHARGPMPQYHFNGADASAIVAYLRSLK